MKNLTDKKINPIKAWYLKKRFFLKNKFLLLRITEENGDRLLVAQSYGWKGRKENRMFRVIEEINATTREPLPWPKRWIVEDRKDPDCGCVMMSVESPAETAHPWWNKRYSVQEEKACRDDV